MSRDPWSEPRTRDERRAASAETFRRFVPDVDPERVESGFERRQGALGSFVYRMVGDMWNRPGLSRRDRSLIIVTTLAAQSRDEELVTHTQVGLRHGLTQTEIEEILLHITAYVGFPAAMAASRNIDEGLRVALGLDRLPDRAPATVKSDDQRTADGADVVASIRGLDPLDPVASLAAIEQRLGGVGVVAHQWAFGEIWSRDELSRRDRSAVVIAILVSLAQTEELALHIQGGLNHGLSRAEIEEIITHLSLYAGLPRAVAAMRTARQVFDR